MTTSPGGAGPGGWDLASASERLSGWLPSQLPNDRLLRMGRNLARSRSRELRRNSGYGERAVSALVAHLVGTGIRLQVQAVSRTRGRRPTAAARAMAARVGDLWEEWAADPRECDLYGDLSWAAQQAVLVGCVVEHGEVLVRRRQPAGVTATGINLRLQGIEPDWIASHLPDTDDRVDGIRYNLSGPNMGRPRSFALHRGNPWDPLTPTLGRVGGGNPWAIEEVPAVDIAHVRRISGPGQRRGIPWLASVAVSLHDLSLFRDATLKRQQVAAMLAMFVTDNQQAQTGLGAVNQSPLFERDSNGIAQLQSATVVRLGRGENITVPPLPQVQGQEAWAQFVLREIASGLGLTYEALTGDLSNVNFSSARQGALEMRLHIDMLRESVIRGQLLLPVWNWWRLAAQPILGRIDRRQIHAVWVPPRRHHVDPVRETAAQLQRLRSGLASLKELISEDGRNPEEVFASIAETATELQTLGLMVRDVPGVMPAAAQAAPPTTEPKVAPLAPAPSAT